MEALKQLRKNRLFMVGLLIPLLFQLIFLCIAIPAIKDGNARIHDMKIAIVNEDVAMGTEISAKLQEVLPFKTEESSDLNASLEAMNDGDLDMVLHIPADFTAKVQQGGAQISYHINQAVPTMTKQAMEGVAVSINQILNENTFANLKDRIEQNTVQGLGTSGLPPAAVAGITANLNRAFDSLKYTNINSDVQKVNNADGFSQTVLPFFTFLTFFIGCIIMAILHTLAFRSLGNGFSRAKVLLSQLGVNIVVSLVIPCIVIGLAAGFDIPFALGTGATWLILSVGFFTLLYAVEMFGSWFSVPGIGLAVVVLFPLQLMTSGLIYSKEILPSFYSGVSTILPATYFGDAMFKAFYGGPSLSGDIWVLLLMAAIFVAVSGLAVFLPRKEKADRTDVRVEA